MTTKKEKFEQMNRLLRIYMTNMQRFFSDTQLDITPQQAHTLVYVKKHPGIIQRELGDYFHLRNASVTSMVKNLERDGYIIRQPDQESARIKRIFLTKKGENKTNKVKQVFDQAYNQIVLQLNEDDIDELIKCISKINHDLKR